MNINDLTDAELIEVKEAWEGVNNGQYHQWTHTRADGWDAFDVARAYPEWCFADNAERMLNTYPHWVAINQPAFAFEREPKWVAADNNRWVKENKPEYWAEYRKAMRLAGYGPHNGMGIEEL